MRVQIVLHQADVLNVRIDLIDEPAHDFGIVLHRALRGHFHMPPACQWFDHHEQIARPFAFVLVIGALWMPRLHRDGRLDISMQHHRFLIQAHGRVVWIILLLVEIQYVFHGGDKLASHAGQTPVFMLPGFEVVFLSNSWIVVGEMLSTKPNSTALCASRRTVQWSCPSGAGLQVMAIK